VEFGTTSAQSYTVNSATGITAVVPNLGTSNTTVAIIVTTPGGTATSSTDFSYFVGTLPSPTISSFAPTSGGAGISVTISGSGFTGATEVQFGTEETQQSFTIISDNEIMDIVPNLGGNNAALAITVMGPGGETISNGNFSYVGLGNEDNNVSTKVNNLADQTIVQSNGVAWSLVGIIIVPIIVIGLIVFFVWKREERIRIVK
jgi:hypothetical protein